MTDNFDDLWDDATSSSEGKFFVARDFTGAYAFLIEVTGYQADLPRRNPKPGERQTENRAIADLTIWNQSADIDADKFVEIKKAIINQTMLAADLSNLVGKLTVKKMAKLPSGGFVWRDVEPQVKAQVKEYFQRRSAQTDTALSAMP